MAILTLTTPDYPEVVVTSLHIETPIGAYPSVKCGLVFGVTKDGVFESGYSRTLDFDGQLAIDFLAAFGNAQATFFQFLVSQGILTGTIS
jgi:hypothetical protein